MIYSKCPTDDYTAEPKVNPFSSDPLQLIAHQFTYFFASLYIKKKMLALKGGLSGGCRCFC